MESSLFSLLFSLFGFPFSVERNWQILPIELGRGGCVVCYCYCLLQFYFTFRPSCLKRK